MPDHGDKEELTEQEIRHEAAEEPEDPITSREALDRGLGVIANTYDSMVKRGRLTVTEKDQRLALIRGTLNYSDLATADVVIEAVIWDFGGVFTTSPFEAFNRFEGVLQASGGLHGEARADDQKQSKQESENQQLHGERIRDGRLHVLRFDVECPKKCRYGAGEEMVQDFGKPEFFHKKLLTIGS